LLVTLVLMMMAFYFAQWEEYYTGTLTLGYVGVTEAQIGAMTIYLLSAALGDEWWGNVIIHVAGRAVRYGDIPFLLSSVSMIPTALANFSEVVHFHSLPGKKSSLASALLNTAPVVVISVGFIAWALASPVYYAHPHVFLLTYGFLVSNLVGRIVLDRVCVERFEPFQPLIVPLFIVPFILHSAFEEAFLYLYCIVAVGSYLHFALSVINDLCDALKIKCLSLPKVNKN
jgi:ethanolaminephosphotransferase